MYREVTMVEVKEVLRLWREGVPTKRLAAQLGLDPKTAFAGRALLPRRPAPCAGHDDDVCDVLLALQPAAGCPRGEGGLPWRAARGDCRWLADGPADEDSETAGATGRRIAYLTQALRGARTAV